MLASGGRQPEPPKAPPPVAPLATVEVLVAKTDLGTGQMISEEDVGWQTWPAAAAELELHQKDRPARRHQGFRRRDRALAVSAGEPIRDSKVVAAKGGGFMAAILPNGMRAVSMDIAPDTGAGGFILPNDHVDIVLTRRDKAAEKATGIEKFVSETILRNVRVLAVDQTVEEKDGQKVVVGKTATVELDPQQAETLALSRQLGTLSLDLAQPSRFAIGDAGRRRVSRRRRAGASTRCATALARKRRPAECTEGMDMARATAIRAAALAGL